MAANPKISNTTNLFSKLENNAEIIVSNNKLTQVIIEDLFIIKRVNKL